MRLAFDHLVVAAERLGEGVDYVEEALGCALEAGGKHARYGTHNALLGLGAGAYLEVIAIDPDAPPPPRARWFGLDGFRGAPRLQTWVCRAEGLTKETLPQGFEGVVDLQRGDLRWRMAEAKGGALPFDACFPGLIDWGDTPHPSTRLKPSGWRLAQLEIAHPRAEALAKALGEVTPVQVAKGGPALSAVLHGSDGREARL